MAGSAAADALAATAGPSYDFLKESEGVPAGHEWTSAEASWALLNHEQVRLTAAIPMENPYCSCKLTRHGLQLQSLWRIHTAAVS